MYLPPHFNESRTEVLHALIAQHPFGILITNGSGGLDANHIPFELDPARGELGVLHCHVARSNPVWRELAEGAEALVVFQGGDAYISPQWYPSKQQHHKQVPTWNYRVVHARGKAIVHDDERYVRGVVARLTRTHEASQPTPWRMGDAPADYLDTLLQAIVGIEIPISSLTGKFKLSQNKEPGDIRGAGNALQRNGEHRIGEAMLDIARSRPD